MNDRGFNLIETVLYIGLLAVLVPTFIGVTLGFLQKSDAVDPRVRMEEKAALLLSELENELAQAQSIVVSSSVFGTSDSSLVYKDQDGVTVTLKRNTDSISFVGGVQSVHRLQRSISGNTQWLTDADLEVEEWNVAVVRDRYGDLTGLNISLVIKMLNAEGVLRQNISLDADTTIHLEPYVSQL